jgi:hypothetical protein
VVISFELQFHRLEEVLACLYGCFSAARLCFSFLVELWNGWKWLVGWASSNFLCCFFGFVKVSLFGCLLRLYETLVQFLLHSGRDGNALAWVYNWDCWEGWVEYICFVCKNKSLGLSRNSGSEVWSVLCLQTNIFFKSTHHRCGNCQIILDYQLQYTTFS